MGPGQMSQQTARALERYAGVPVEALYCIAVRCVTTLVNGAMCRAPAGRSRACNAHVNACLVVGRWWRSKRPASSNGALQ